jgi:hypothetical protein
LLRVRIWLLSALIISLTLGAPATALAAECGQLDATLGTCNINASTDDTGATLSGTGEIPGEPGIPNSGGPDDPLADCIYILNDRCLMAGPSKGRTQPITLADIAHFRPDPGIDSMQPEGWMIVDLDTNFYATGASQIHTGTLLGAPASVRFTPVSWHWNYGDGSASTRSTPGTTWAALGKREFDATSTSHIYRTPGSVTITLTIDFAAEYRVGNISWTDIAGTIPVPANPLYATVGDAKTVLVERACDANPRGPGC